MSLTENELALAVMDDDGWGCAIVSAPEPPPAEITITVAGRCFQISLTDLRDALESEAAGVRFIPPDGYRFRADRRLDPEGS